MDDWLKKTFDRLGRAIGEQPGYFLIVPILLSALCASGFQRVKFMADPEYLFRYTCQCIKIISLHIIHPIIEQCTGVIGTESSQGEF